MESLQEKNVYRIFAGGNHSWILLDAYVPRRAGYQHPSPLKGEEEKSQSPTKTVDQLQLTNYAQKTKQETTTHADLQRRKIAEQAK